MTPNPIETTYTSGSVLYAVVHRGDGKIWNDVAQEWQAYNNANWISYAFPLTEQGISGYFRADFPAGAVGDFLTTEVVYNQAGGAPALGDAPATGIGQSQGVDVAAVSKSCLAAQRLALSLGGMITGAVTGAATATLTSFTTTLADAVNDVYQGRAILFTSGGLVRQFGYISAYRGDLGLITVSGPFTAAPGVADTFIIV